MERTRPSFSSGGPPEQLGTPLSNPVELMVIAIPSVSEAARFAEVLGYLVESSSIRILDVVVVTTQTGGTFTSLEFEEVAGLALLRDVEGEVGGWLSADDIAMVADALSPGTTALVLVMEDVWAGPLADVVHQCGGQIVGGERIPTARTGRGRRG